MEERFLHFQYFYVIISKVEKRTHNCQAMSALLKKLHVHFDDDVLSEPVTKQNLDDDSDARKSTMLNYSRDQLLEFGQSKASKEPPKMFDLSGADDKRLEKIRNVLKNSDIWKSWIQSKYKFHWTIFFAEHFGLNHSFKSIKMKKSG